MKKYFISILISALFIPVYSTAADFKVACTDEKPYFYQGDDGKVMGQIYDTAAAVMNKAGLSAEYSIMTWNMAYKSALDEENFMLSCLGRTPLSESLFNWVGPVAAAETYSFYKLKSKNAFISYLEDFRQYNIGVLSSPHIEEFISKKGLDSAAQVAPTKTRLLQMLKSGQVDFILISDRDIASEVKLMGLGPDDFAPAFYAYKRVESLAVSKSTPEKTVDKLKKAYDDLKSEGKITLVE